MAIFIWRNFHLTVDAVVNGLISNIILWDELLFYGAALIMRMFERIVFLVLCFVLFALAVCGEPPAGYYDSAIGLSGNALRVALHNIIRNHTRVSYSNSARVIIADACQDPDNSSNIIDVYKNASYAKTDSASWGMEHVWPKSFGFPKETTCSYPYSDLHHLFACDSGYNSARSNKFYDNCLSGCAAYSVIGFPEYSNYANPRSWEVWMNRRGDVARALFYMDVRYEGGKHDVTNCDEPDLILTNDPDLIVSSSENLSIAYMGILDTLLQWHKDDPVDDRERLHNDVVYNSRQKNRNPFVDHPEWVEAIWGNLVPTPTAEPTATPKPSPSPTPAIGVLPGDIVINEIDYDDPGKDTRSFVELKNISQKIIDLSTMEIVGLNGGSTSDYFIYRFQSHQLKPGEYWVLGTTADSENVAAFVDETMTGVASLQNGPNDGVYLRLKSDSSVIIDSVSYEGASAHPAGSPDTGDAGTDSDTVADLSLSRVPDGRDTNDNSSDFKLQKSTPGSANADLTTPTPTGTPLPTQTPAPQIKPGEIVINEIDYDNTGKDTQSFIELKNVSNRAIDLSEIVVVGMNNQTPYFTYNLASNLLPPQGYWVLGTRDDSTSITAFINETMTGVASLQNGPNDGVYLRLKSDSSVIIDSVSYEGADAHPAGAPDTGDAGTDPGNAMDISLSRIPDGRDTNDNSSDFKLQKSTPGATNSPSSDIGTGLSLH